VEGRGFLKELPEGGSCISISGKKREKEGGGIQTPLHFVSDVGASNGIQGLTMEKDGDGDPGRAYQARGLSSSTSKKQKPLEKNRAPGKWRNAKAQWRTNQAQRVGSSPKTRIHKEGEAENKRSAR